jgi:hypothetical protein
VQVSLNRDFVPVEACDMEHDGFTVDDVARVLRSNIRHVQKLMTMGLLRVDIGGPRALVSRQELDRFLRENPGWVR